jgi:acyl-coenzyme A thioesterase PaaI-like protein
MPDPSPDASSPDANPAGREPGAAGIVAPGSSAWPDFINELATAEPSPRRSELHRAGDALRHIVDRLHGNPAPADELAAVADELERLAARLDAFPGGSIYEGFAESPLAGRDPHAFFDHSPMLGRANPLAPPVELTVEGDAVRGRVTFGSAYEGPPGCVHGGYVAAAFDEVLGSTQSLAGRPGMTARLTINYRSPTPLHQELTFEGRVVDVSGRKTYTRGTLHAGERLCAEGEGLFVAIAFDRISEMQRRRDASFGPGADVS